MRLAFVLLLCTTASSTICHAQPTHVIRETPITCTSNCFALEEVVTFLDNAGHIFQDPMSVVRTADDRYVIANPQGPNPVYASTGKFLQLLGRKGRGPNEFFTPGFLAVGSGDSIHVFDFTNVRESVISPTLDYVRDVQFPYQVLRFVATPDGRRFVNARVRTPDLINIPIHELDADNKIVRSFGLRPEFENFGPRLAWPDWRNLAVSKDNTLFASYLPRYIIDEWSLDGEALAIYERDADWFEPYTEAPRIRPGGNLRPRVVAIRSIAPRVLMVLISAPAEDWEENLEPITVDGRTRYRVVIEQLHETRIEVLDLAAETVVASEVFSAYMPGFVSGTADLLFSPTVDPAGAPAIRIFRLTHTP